MSTLARIRRPTASSPERRKGISLQISIVREIERGDLVRMDREVFVGFYAQHPNENGAPTAIHSTSRQPISVFDFLQIRKDGGILKRSIS
ncbi:hypothetical protein [Rhizobium sp. NXC24]|uniref:hypothetical protein n=1 Tax=Rhizobium sp. NXC24 TaxID=2048897 RepID=UPI001FE18819|nr:hypothetical protein [Rhizobium sp. NXC24]